MADGLGFAWWDSWIWGSGGVGNQSDLSFPQFIFGWLVGLDCMELNRKIPTNPPSPSTCLVLPPTFPFASQGNQKKPVEYSSHSRNFPRYFGIQYSTHVSARLPAYGPHLDCAAPLVSLVYFSSMKCRACLVPQKFKFWHHVKRRFSITSNLWYMYGVLNVDEIKN